MEDNEINAKVLEMQRRIFKIFEEEKLRPSWAIATLIDSLSVTIAGMGKDMAPEFIQEMLTQCGHQVRACVEEYLEIMKKL